MAKNYESESKNSRNYTGTSDKNSYGNEMKTDIDWIRRGKCPS